MNAHVTDFYSGFEGEPEIRFTLKAPTGEERVLRLWEGYFEELLERIDPVGGCWTGLALPYHLHEGWYEDAPWRVEDIEAIARQWIDIVVADLSTETQAVHAAVLGLLAQAAAEGDSELWISRD